MLHVLPSPESPMASTGAPAPAPAAAPAAAPGPAPASGNEGGGGPPGNPLSVNTDPPKDATVMKPDVLPPRHDKPPTGQSHIPHGFQDRFDASVRGRAALLKQASSMRLVPLSDLQERSLCFFDRYSPTRQRCYRIITNKWFDRAIILLIVLNCIILALNDPLDEDRTSTRNTIIDESEIFFTIVFTIEAVLKIIAMGFVGEKSYLADRWNWIDFIVVVTGYVSMAPGVDNFSALRTFRVLRPLRTLTSIPGMRVIVQSMLASIPALFNVFLMCLFIFFIFGIIGVQLWNGVLKGRCAYESSPGNFVVDEREIFCALDCDDNYCTKTFGDSCPVSAPDLLPMECIKFENPADGFVSFDNIGVACLTIFTSITLEGWVDVLYGLNATWGIPWFNAIYFILLIMFGSFFMLNLALAVIWEEYVKADEAEEEKMRKERLTVAETLLNSGEMTEDELIAEGFLDYKGQLEATQPSSPNDLAKTSADPSSGGQALAASGEASEDDPGAGVGLLENHESEGETKEGAAEPRLPHHRSRGSRRGSISRSRRSSAAGDIPAATMVGGGVDGRRASSCGTDGEGDSQAGRPRTYSNQAIKDAHAAVAKRRRASQVTLASRYSRFSHRNPREGTPLYRLVNNKWFSGFIVGAILANTAVLAMEHHNAPDDFVEALDILNYVFTAIFLIEMILKLLGLGLREYLESKFNIFDGVIVIISIVELVIEFAGGGGDGTGLSALRSFRLLRVFRLARNWPDLQRLLATIAKSVVDVANASLVLLIIMFIFVLLGMQLFGGKFDEDSRAHFDNIWWAFVTVFQVLTGENWNEVLYTSMSAVGAEASVYFVLLNIVGNYLILNLFLAILLGNFDTIDDDGNDTEHAHHHHVLNAPPKGSSVAPKGKPADQDTDEAPPGASGAVSPLPQPTDEPESKRAGGTGAGAGAGVQRARNGSRSPPSSPMSPGKSGSPITGNPYGRPGTAPVVSASGVSVSAASNATSRDITPRNFGSEGPPATTDLLMRQPLIAEVSEEEPTGRGAEDERRIELPPIVGARPVSDGHTDLGMPSSSMPGVPSSRPLTDPVSQDKEDKGRPEPTSDAAASQEDGPPGPLAARKGTPQPGGLETDGRPDKTGVEAFASEDLEAMEGHASLFDHPNLGADTIEKNALASELASRPKSAPPSGPASCNEYSLYCLSPTNSFRILCARIITHKFFEATILFLIAVSSILLAMDEPRVSDCKDLPSSDPDNCIVLADFLYFADLIITSMFVIEMLLKIFALGFVVNKSAYLRSSWNVLDFIIVVVSVLSLALGGDSQLKALRSLRALRALRPLRVVSRYPSLKLVVNSIFGSLPRVRNVALVNMLFILIFAIVGVQNWAGALNSCNDESINETCTNKFTCLTECTGIYNTTGLDCIQQPTELDVNLCLNNPVGRPFPRIWSTHLTGPANFDDIFHSLLMVFEVATGEMWPDLMYVTVDAVGPDEPLDRDYNQAAALYFLLINVVCAFFMLEIFTGVIIDNFNRMKEDSTGSALLTKPQQMWVESMKLMLSVEPAVVLTRPANASRLRGNVYMLARSKAFEVFIMVCIVFNTIVLALTWADQSHDVVDALDIINWVFTAIFTLEAAIKLYGFGIRPYFRVGWNRFDFFLVVASYAGVAVDLPSLASLFRVFRVLRIFRLVRTSRGLLQLLRTLVFSIPSLVNVGAILLLVYFIFAIVAMNLFSDIKHGEFLNDDANFESFFVSMLTLFRISTGESYNGIMHDCMVEEPFCSSDADNCGFPVFAPIYFIMFYMLTAFILLNLLVAIILDNFSDTVALDEEKEVFTLTDDLLNHFKEEWSKLDPSASKYIPATSMPKLITSLKYPLGLKDTPGVQHNISAYKAARNMLKNLEIPELDGKVHFHAVLQQLSHAASGGVQLPEEVQVTQQLEQKRRRKLKEISNAPHSVRETLAAELLQSVFRSHRARKAPHMVQMRQVVELRMQRHRREKIRKAQLGVSDEQDSSEPRGTSPKRVAFKGDESEKPPRDPHAPSKRSSVSDAEGRNATGAEARAGAGAGAGAGAAAGAGAGAGAGPGADGSASGGSPTARQTHKLANAGDSDGIDRSSVHTEDMPA